MNEMTILPRKPTENNKEYSYRVLYYNIMTMKLPPGTSITENEVAEQLNISRTPVHEALTMLKAEYLVDIVPQSGSSVTLINLRNVREGLFMRTTLEPAIYRQLSGCIKSEYLKKMADNLDEASELITLEESEEAVDHFIKLDDEFHKLAYIAAEKPNLWRATSTVCSHFLRIRYQESILIKKDLSHIYEEHKQLYNYLLLGGSKAFDLDAFYDNHLFYFKSYFPHILEKYPQYFIIDI